MGGAIAAWYHCGRWCGGPAGLELHENVLSPEEQANMVVIIEQWVVQVSLLAPHGHCFWSMHICILPALVVTTSGPCIHAACHTATSSSCETLVHLSMQLLQQQNLDGQHATSLASCVLQATEPVNLQQDVIAASNLAPAYDDQSSLWALICAGQAREAEGAHLQCPSQVGSWQGQDHLPVWLLLQLCH